MVGGDIFYHGDILPLFNQNRPGSGLTAFVRPL